MSVRLKVLATTALVAAFPVASAAYLTALAQTPAPAGEQAADSDEEVVVTGSYIKRKDLKSASPILVIDQNQLDKEGINQVSDVIKNLTINTGSRFAFDQSNNGRGGKASFNLRGLGSTATLTLFNGRRVAPRETQANIFPLNAIGRVEVLKDGASALYGSDAVAGVVNLIGRHVDGFELEAQYLTTTTLGDESQDISFSGAWGASSANGSVDLFFTYTRRTQSQAADRFVRTSSSRTIPGFPGTFQMLAPVTTGPYAGRPTGALVADPACGTIGNTFINSAGRCVSSVTNYLDFISEYDQFSVFAQGEYRVGDRLTFKGDVLFSDLSDFPSEYVSSTSIIANVPASHPDNIFGVPVRFIGLAGDPSRGKRNWSTTTWRVSPSITYELNDSWYIEAGYTYYNELLNQVQRAVNTDLLRLADALNGVGGQNRNQRFNPFGTALTNPARANDPDLLLFITPEQLLIAETKYQTYDFVIAGDLFHLSGGPVGVAFGAQHRSESADQALDPLVLGYVGQRGAVQQPPKLRTQEVDALFAETRIPILDTLELNAAVRYEDYGGGLGSTTDPKIAVRWEATDWLTLRASWGTSFRAPTPAQLDGGRVSRVNLPYANPRSGPNCSGTTAAFADAFNVGNPNLNPEQSENVNFGVQLQPLSGLRITADYWNYKFKDQVARSSGQAIILADCLATNGGAVADPRIRTNVLGDIVSVDVTLDNLSTLETDGIDFNIGYEFDLEDYGLLSIDSTTTFINSYDIQATPGGLVVDGAGSRNKLTNSVSTPRWRSNTTINWAIGDHSLTAVARYVSTYRDDVTGADVGSFPTLDLQYAYSFANPMGFEGVTKVELGVMNVFDEQAPDVNETWGFDSSVHDPRGRMLYVRAKQSF